MVTGKVPPVADVDGSAAGSVPATWVVPAESSPELPQAARTATVMPASTTVRAKPGGFDRMGHPPSMSGGRRAPARHPGGAARTTLPPRVQFGGAGKATGLVPPGGASPLRDSAGITPDFATVAPLGRVRAR